MSIDRSDLEFEIRRLEDRLEGMERRQRYANSRIRHDIASLLSLIVVGSFTVGLMYNGYSDWWMFLILFIGFPAFQAWLAHRVDKQELP